MTETIAPLSASGLPLPKRWLAIIATIWAGQAVSMITSYAAGYAAVWYITETTGSALALAVASICAYLPQGLLSPFGGVIADKSIIDEKEFNDKLESVAALAISDACTGSNPRQPSQEEMKKLLLAVYYDKDIDF